MKYIALLISFLVLFSGCIGSKSQEQQSLEKVIVNIPEVQKDIKDYPNYISIYNVTLIKNDADVLSENVSEIKPVNSYLFFVTNSMFYDKGYVFQMLENGTIISEISYDSYKARTNLYLKEYTPKQDTTCPAASLKIDDVKYDGNTVHVTVSNVGKYDFTNMYLVTVSGNNYDLHKTGVNLVQGASYTFSQDAQGVTDVQIFSENCPQLKVKKTVL